MTSLLSPSEFKELVSGRRKGVVASLFRAGLSLVELPYTLVVKMRNRRYDLERAEIHRVEAPVICVGNLTMGGTGKTPMVHYVARWFREQGIRVAIVSRGYGSVGGQQNDEAKEMQSRLPDVPQVQNSDRYAAAKLATDELEMQVIVLDDGFQHRRLARDLDIVLIDALEPFGFEHVFPRGTLREPMSGIDRAHIVALSRSDMVSEDRRREIRRRVEKLAPKAEWLEVAHAPKRLDSLNDSTDISWLKGKRVLAFCGLGNPTGFQKTLLACGAEVLDFREFPDHHDYTRDDVEALKKWAIDHEPEMLVCTHKDFVKLEIDQISAVPLRALIVELSVLAGEDVLHESLLRLRPVNAADQESLER